MKSLAIYIYYAAAILVLGLGGTVTTRAQNATDCANLLKFGIYDKFRTFTTESHYKQVKEFFENNTFSSRQQAEQKAGELGLQIDGILGLNLGGSTSSNNFEEWKQKLLRTSYLEARSFGLTDTAIETISGRMTSLVEACLTRSGVHAYVIPAADNQTFTVTVDFVPTTSNPGHTTTRGTISVQPSSVAAQCSPASFLNQPIEVGIQGRSLSCRRLPSDTVTVVVNMDDGSPTFTYDAFVIPPIDVRFGANPGTINRGGATLLSWDVRNALNVSLADFGPVLTTGSRSVSPTETTEYKLNVVGLDGKTASVPAAVTVIQPQPHLTGARVAFHTTDDNKDHDTNVVINVICDSGTVASVSSNFGGEFKDHRHYGPFGMTVLAPQPVNRVNGVCRAELTEQPNGHDEWHFNWWVELTFSSGVTIRSATRAGNVDHDRPHATVNF
ncbi:MAG TPA: hypothetical protein VIQ24_04865 [Pyrinomonadaceae bacterium]